MTYEEYELYIKASFEKELKNEFNREVQIKHQEDLQTPTGRKYNIDLNYKFQLGGVEYLTIIECKNWKYSVTRDIVLSLKEKAQELGAHKAILVTTKGFQEGAIQYAREKGVGLVKMTTRGKKELITAFIESNHTNIISELKNETEISEEEQTPEFIGIMFPNKSIKEYLGETFGFKFVEVLDSYSEKLDNFDIEIVDQQTKLLINNIPDNWSKEYRNIETCGLGIKLENDRKIKITNQFILYLKEKLLNAIS